MKHIIFLFTITLFHTMLMAQTEESKKLVTKTGDISGTLLIPEITKQIPVVLIIAGSGPTDRNGNNPIMTNNSLKMLAEALQAKGFASLRYDKRGIGKSKDAMISENELRFENYIDDAKQWVNVLQQDERFSEICILGHSEGSLIGMIASQSEKVSKFISLAGLGRPGGKIILEQLKNQSQTTAEVALPIIKSLESGKTVEQIPIGLFSIFRPSVQPYLISWFAYNPIKEISKLKKPVLILQGTTDIQVPVSDAEQLAAAHKKAKKIIISGMNHVLKEAELDRQKNVATYNDPNMPIKKELTEAIVTFIK